MDKNHDNRSEPNSNNASGSFNREKIEKMSEREAKNTCYQLLNALIKSESLVNSQKRIINHLHVVQEEKAENQKYEPNGSILEKILFIFSLKQKIMTVQELTAGLLDYDPLLRQKWTNPYKSISQAMYQGVKLSRIAKYQKIGLHGFAYALPEWFENNCLNPKYKR